MSAYVKFLMYDEQIHMPDGGGYRVFLSQELGVSLIIYQLPTNFNHDFQNPLTTLALSMKILGIYQHRWA